MNPKCQLPANRHLPACPTLWGGGTWLPALWLGLLLSVAILSLFPRPAGAGEAPRLLRIGTGGSSGVYYPIGTAIAQGLTGLDGDPGRRSEGECGVAGHMGVAQQSAGSVENARAVTGGEIELALVQADVAAQAFHAQGAFSEDAAAPAIRAVASLYPEKLQIVTRSDTGIRQVADFCGKRISIDEAGSGTLAVMRSVLAAHGLDEADFQPVYLKPAFTHDKMTSGEVQGFVAMTGTPMAAIVRLADVGLHLVPIDPAVGADIQARVPYLVPGVIPAGVYRGIPRTPTLQVHALLVVSAALADDLVYRLTAALWSNRTRGLLETVHPQGRAITLGSALDGLSVPLHPGARRFYRDKEMAPKDILNP